MGQAARRPFSRNLPRSEGETSLAGADGRNDPDQTGLVVGPTEEDVGREQSASFSGVNQIYGRELIFGAVLLTVSLTVDHPFQVTQ